MEDKVMFEKEYVEAIPNPNPYVMTQKQYEETKYRMLSKEELELRERNARLVKKVCDQINKETDLGR